MPVSSTYAAQIVVLLAFVLPKFGVTLGNDDLNLMVQGIFILGGVIWTLYQRYQAGGITLLGVRL